jgi:phosphatidylethanolamine/phosphatidyl-N-methylethanolamine N-methyltransferase
MRSGPGRLLISIKSSAFLDRTPVTHVIVRGASGSVRVVAGWRNRVIVSKSPMDDSLYFLRRFLRRPKHVASVWPSSRHLARRMFHDLDLKTGDLVIEYGPGTGAFTVEVERLRRIGVGLRYLGIEKDPGMYDFLVHRFPSLDFVLGDACDILDISVSRGLPPAAAVISGLPLMFIERASLLRIFTGTSACLRPDGVFRTFSYAHSYPTRVAGELRDLMSLCFDEYHRSTPVLRNLPPAVVLSGRGPRLAERPACIEAAAAPMAAADHALRRKARLSRRGRNKPENRRAVGGGRF